MFKMKSYLFLLNMVLITYQFDESLYGKPRNYTQVNGYHFHTLFLQNNSASTAEAESFRGFIMNLTQQDYLSDCTVGSLIARPFAEYPIGSFSTCCNSTALPRAIPLFMHNHGNLSVVLHGLTRENLLDHTKRAMFLGPVYPLDISNTVEFRDPPLKCVAT